MRAFSRREASFRWMPLCARLSIVATAMYTSQDGAGMTKQREVWSWSARDPSAIHSASPVERPMNIACSALSVACVRLGSAKMVSIAMELFMAGRPELVIVLAPVKILMPVREFRIRMRAPLMTDWRRVAIACL